MSQYEESKHRRDDRGRFTTKTLDEQLRGLNQFSPDEVIETALRNASNFEKDALAEELSGNAQTAYMLRRWADSERRTAHNFARAREDVAASR